MDYATRITDIRGDLKRQGDQRPSDLDTVTRPLWMAVQGL